MESRNNGLKIMLSVYILIILCAFLFVTVVSTTSNQMMATAVIDQTHRTSVTSVHEEAGENGQAVTVGKRVPELPITNIHIGRIH